MNLKTYFPSLTEDQLKKYEVLGDIFLEWNKDINLSSFHDRNTVLLKHICDSLLLLSFSRIKEGDTVMDLGTGGGFPGLALAIYYPDVHFLLVDSIEKKIAAVQDMAQKLGLKNVKCLAARAEELARNAKYREQCNVVVARALAPFPVLLEYCLPFVKVSGTFIAYQGPEIIKKIDQYITLISRLGGKFKELKKCTLPEEGSQRTFVLIEKCSKISDEFPRRIGIPQKKPLA